MRGQHRFMCSRTRELGKEENVTGTALAYHAAGSEFDAQHYRHVNREEGTGKED